MDVEGEVGWTRWSHSGKEIFVMAEDSAYVARVETEPTFRVLEVEALFAWQEGGGFGYVGSRAHNGLYDVHPDDQRFLLARWEPALPAELMLAQNFLDELERRVR